MTNTASLLAKSGCQSLTDSSIVIPNLLQSAAWSAFDRRFIYDPRELLFIQKSERGIYSRAFT